MTKNILATLLFSLTMTLIAHAEKIEDNSFFLEEAYNQDPGVVQLIQSYQYTKKKCAG